MSATAALCLVIATCACAREVALTSKDFANAKLLKEIPTDVVDPTAPGKFEGDMDLNGHTIAEYAGSSLPDDPDIQSNGIRSLYQRWPNGQIPYTVSSSFSSYERSRIAAAISDYDRYTCVRWVPRTTQRDYVYFFKDGGCYSMVGKIGGRQSLSLGTGCVTKGIIMHEMMHAAGFFHEQSRNDRDNYITIRTENMIPGTESQFTKYSLNRITHLGTAYDYGSIMHYGKYAFSRNRQPTITTRQSGVTIGQRERLSQTDIRKLNLMYNCGNTRPATQAPATAGPRPPTSGTCEDTRSDCAYYRRQEGGCSVPWMRTLCKSTCGLCRGTPGGPAPPTASCTDASRFSRYCSGFARKGYCTAGGSTRGFMQRNCCATCRRN